MLFRSDLDMAKQIWLFLEKNLLRTDGTPTHRWRAGQRDDVHLLEDYAGLLQALVDLHQGTLEPVYLVRATGLAEEMLKRFGDPQGGGLWSTADTSLIARMKDDYDGAEPSGNAVAALALTELARLTDQPCWRKAAAEILEGLAERIRRLPQAVPHALMAFQRLSEPPARLILAGEGWERLQATAGEVYRPDLLITRATEEHPSEFVRGLARGAKKATAYLCEGESCQLPLRETKDLIRKLRRD